MATLCVRGATLFGLVLCSLVYLSVCEVYSTAAYVPVAECPANTILLTAPDPSTPGSTVPVRCLPHQTGLCYFQIAAQNISVDNVCCWYNQVDYFCCINMTVTCPSYANKTVVIHKPRHYYGGNQPILAPPANNVGYRHKRMAETVTEQVQEEQPTLRVHHNGRGLAGYAASPRQAYTKHNNYKPIKQQKGH